MSWPATKLAPFGGTVSVTCGKPGTGVGVGLGEGVGVGVGVGLPEVPPKYRPLTTAVFPPTLLTTNLTRPRTFQIRYCPPVNEEIARLSSNTLVAQSTTSTRNERLLPSQSRL